MKTKIIVILILISHFAIAQRVPDNYDFSLDTVVRVVAPTGLQSLDNSFTYSIASYFDPLYEGSKDRLTNFRNYGPPDYTLPGPYLVWEMNSYSSFTFQDATTNNNDGTVPGDEIWTYTSSGKINGAVYADDGGSWVASPTDLVDVDTLTVSCWWYGDASLGADNQSLLWLCTPFGTTTTRLWAVENSASTGNNLIKFTDYSGAISYEQTIPAGTFQFADNTWVHVVVTRVPSNAKVYANGSLVATYTRTFNDLDNRLMTLNSRDGSNWGSAGARYDQFVVWHKELNLTQIQYLYNSGSGRAYVDW